MIIKNAFSLYDVSETLGKKNNPTILAWAKELKDDLAKVYLADEIPWCGFFVAVVVKRSSKQVVKNPLWALNR